MTSYWKALVGAAALALSANASHASVVTFFGETLSPGGTASGAAAAARADFLSNLSGGIGTENFELPTALPNIDFPGSTGTITASLTGGGTSIEDSSGNGRFATSGTRFVETGAGGDFAVETSSGFSAFGFYGTDLGDFGNGLTLRLDVVGGGSLDLDVPLTRGRGGSTDGSLIFFGFIDSVNSFDRVAFLNQPGGVDVFGFDDLTIGDAAQVTTSPIPLPAGMPLLALGLAGLGLAKGRKARRA